MSIVCNENGTEFKIKIPKLVRRWWAENIGGVILLTVRYGNKLIEFDKGKNAIELSSKADLEPTLQSIKKAVDSESKFNTDWLGRSECYLGTLRFKQKEPYANI